MRDGAIQAYEQASDKPVSKQSPFSVDAYSSYAPVGENDYHPCSQFDRGREAKFRVMAPASC